jgi:hypothetical protein
MLSFSMPADPQQLTAALRTVCGRNLQRVPAGACSSRVLGLRNRLRCGAVNPFGYSSMSSHRLPLRFPEENSSTDLAPDNRILKKLIPLYRHVWYRFRSTR